MNMKIREVVGAMNTIHRSPLPFLFSPQIEMILMRRIMGGTA
jgi:hypothetical protein